MSNPTAAQLALLRLAAQDEIRIHRDTGVCVCGDKHIDRKTMIECRRAGWLTRASDHVNGPSYAVNAEGRACLTGTLATTISSNPSHYVESGEPEGVVNGPGVETEIITNEVPKPRSKKSRRRKKTKKPESES